MLFQCAYKQSWALVIFVFSAFPVQAETVVRYAVDPFPPWIIVNDEKPIQGIDVRLIDAISNAMDVKAELLVCPWARCLKMLENGNADAMINVFKTPQRMEYIEYIEPQISLDPPKAFYIHADTKGDITDYEQLQFKIVGTVRGTSYFKRFDDDLTIKKVEVVTDIQLIEMLNKKRLDAFIGTEATIDYLVSQSEKSNHIKKAAYFYNSQRPTYLGLSKRSHLYTPENIKRLKRTISELQSNNDIQRITESFYQDHDMIYPQRSIAVINDH